MPTGVNWTPELESFALSKVGQAYSQYQAMLGYLGKWTNPDLWDCSRYAGAVMDAAGIKTGDGWESPSLMAQRMMEAGKEMQLIAKDD